MKLYISFTLILILGACTPANKKIQTSYNKTVTSESPYLVILGNVQDAGSPHTGCKKDCCKDLFLHPDPTRKVVSLGLIDPAGQKKYLIEATPDLPAQMKNLFTQAAFGTQETPDGIFLTHAHIGHYTGLMYLGRESMNAAGVSVYAMPRMLQYLQTNGPWSQLVSLHNITLQPLTGNKAIPLTPSLKIMPFLVPHRDEYSETVGYIIEGSSKKALFIPDIDKWEKWGTDITDAIAGVDYAFIDGTFYDAEEVNNRNIAEIPHPFIIESMERFKELPASEKAKVYFIHFNHTNPVLNPSGPQSKTVLEKGFKIARYNQVIML